MVYWTLAAAGILGLLILVWYLQRLGRKSAERDDMKQVLDDIHTAKLVQDRLRADPAFARRVRARFTRKLL